MRFAFLGSAILMVLAISFLLFAYSPWLRRQPSSASQQASSTTVSAVPVGVSAEPLPSAKAATSTAASNSIAWATTTFDGLIFSYPPDWDAELYSSGKDRLYLDISPSATDSPIVDLQVHSDSNSNSESKENSIEFAQQNNPRAGYVEMPDICVASLGTCAKVWQTSDFQTSEYPRLTYLIPIRGDVISIDPGLHFTEGAHEKQIESVEAFLLQFINAISVQS